MDDELKKLLDDLKCRVNSEEIPKDWHKTVKDFLKKEAQARNEYRIQRLLVTCGIKPKQMRTFDQFDWHFNPKAPKQEILTLKNSNWIDEAANLTLIGDVGIGKSHIAKSFCYDAVTQGYSTLFITVFDIISKIKTSPSPMRRIDYYGKNIRVLCLDELGYTYHSKEDTDLLFQIISKRCECLPTIVTSNLIPKQWGSIFSGPAASAILDRLSFNGKFLTWGGKSFRPQRRKK